MIVDTNRAAHAAGRNICARRRERRWAWAGCSVLGLAVPLAAVGWAAALLTVERAGGAPPRREAVAHVAADPDTALHQTAAVRMAVRLVGAMPARPGSATPTEAPTQTTPAPLAALPAQRPSPRQSASAATPAGAAPSGTGDDRALLQTSQAASPQRTQPGAADSDRGDGQRGDVATARFYLYREVDIPAEPVSGWSLDAGDLDALATSRLVFTLLVGSDGSILYCSVDAPERLPPDTRQRLAARLRATPMHPARRAGLPVASRRRVELYTDSGA